MNVWRIHNFEFSACIGEWILPKDTQDEFHLCSDALWTIMFMFSRWWCDMRATPSLAVASFAQFMFNLKFNFFSRSHIEHAPLTRVRTLCVTFKVCEMPNRQKTSPLQSRQREWTAGHNILLHAKLLCSTLNGKHIYVCITTCTQSGFTVRWRLKMIAWQCT